MISSPLSFRSSLLCSCLLLLSSCADAPTETKRELTADERLRQGELLKELLEPEGKHRHPREIEGQEVSDYSELLALADFVKEEGDETHYHFSLEGISQNQEGWGTLVIRTYGEKITEAETYYPEW
jgi:hypothetical protein